MGVDLQRDSQARVPQNDLRVTGRNAEDLQQRGNGVPHMVKLDQQDVIRLGDAPERPDEVPRPTGRPVLVVKTRSVCGHAEPISAR